MPERVAGLVTDEARDGLPCDRRQPRVVMGPERGEVRPRLVPALVIEPDHIGGDEERPDPLGEVLVEVGLLAHPVHVGHVRRAVVLGLGTPGQEDAGDGS
jgi:hypothetical protein